MDRAERQPRAAPSAPANDSQALPALRLGLCAPPPHLEEQRPRLPPRPLDLHGPAESPPLSRGHQGLITCENASQSRDHSRQWQNVQETPASGSPGNEQHPVSSRRIHTATGHGPQTPVCPSTAQPPAPWSPAQWGFRKGSSSSVPSTAVETGFVRGFRVRSPRERHAGTGRPGFPGLGGESLYKLETHSSPTGPVLTQQKLHPRVHATPALCPHRHRMLNESAGGQQARSPHFCLPLCPGAGRIHVLKAKKTPNAPFSCLLSIPQMQ